jgi:hypothetical protein
MTRAASRHNALISIVCREGNVETTLGALPWTELRTGLWKGILPEFMRHRPESHPQARRIQNAEKYHKFVFSTPSPASIDTATDLI